MQGDKPFPPPPPARLTGCVLCPPRSRETMTTDEATKSEGEVQAAALAERGEDITPSKDRGVLKVRGICSVLPSCTLGCRSPQPSGSHRTLGLSSFISKAKRMSIAWRKGEWSGG